MFILNTNHCMKFLYLNLFLLFVALFPIGKLCAQRTTLGKEFYVGFMENNRTDDQLDKSVLIITANENTSGSIQIPSQTIYFSLKKGEQFIREFEDIQENLIHRNSGVVEKRVVRILSTGDIAVHAINGRSFSTDGTVVLPLAALGKEYLISAHYDVFNPTLDPGVNENFESTLLLIASADNTQIEIKVSAPTVNTIPAGSIIVINLNAGQTYQIKAKGDLTGTSVKVVNSTVDDCKVIAVFGGNKKTSVGNCGTSGDVLFQQAYPINSWGKQYIHIPMMGRSSGDLVKILAAENGTDVTINRIARGTLNSGEFMKIDFGNSETAVIETSKPSAVSVLQKSAQCNSFGMPSLGDPTLITMSPTNQRLKSIYFSTGKLFSIANDKTVHWLNVLVPKGSEKQTILNGSEIGAEFLPVKNAEFSYGRVQLQEGVNHLENPEGFIGYIYGNGQIESYGYAIGASLDNIRYEAESTYKFDVIGDHVACLGQEGTWEIMPDKDIFTSYSWDFGDNSSMPSGKSAEHTYQKEGNYEVVVTASTGTGACDSEEKFRFEVAVKTVSIKLDGPISVCPSNAELNYSLSDTLNVVQIIWEIDGGKIVSQSATEATVIWSSLKNEGFIRATPVAANGCLGEVQELKINVADNYVPPIPEGQSGFCTANPGPLTYKVPFPDQSKIYDWTITGGVILRGQDTEQIVVDWKLEAPIQAIQYTESSRLNASCRGVSELLVLVDFQPIQLTEINLVRPSCLGKPDGSFSIEIKGGSGNFHYLWTHDPLLNTATLENLDAGIYEVNVTDLSGCGKEQLIVVLNTIPSIGTNTINITPPRCFDSKDGSMKVDVEGGSPPYIIENYSSTWDGKSLFVQGLSKGPRSFTVIDSNRCTFEFSTDVPGPDELKVVFEEEKPSCPNGDNGVILAKAIGGTPPYSYEWEDGSKDEKIENLPSGEFTVRIVDANGCQVTSIAKVSAGKPGVRMPTGYNPLEGFYGPVTNCSITYELIIFDRWGELIYISTESWNGKLADRDAPIATYTYLLRYQYLLGTQQASDELRGSFTLIR